MLVSLAPHPIAPVVPIDVARDVAASLRRRNVPFADLPPGCQQLIAMLIEDPPVPYAEISARLGISAGSIGPSRGRCVEKLRRHPAIAALIDAETGGTE